MEENGARRIRRAAVAANMLAALGAAVLLGLSKTLAAFILVVLATSVDVLEGPTRE
jgi:hypothetical protein